MNRRIITAAFAVLAAGATIADAQTQTLYKLIDKNGKVTYSETPPKDFPGQVIRIEIDPNRNTATLPKPKEAQPARETANDARSRAPAQAAADAASARERLEAAKKALADAQLNPAEGEVSFIGNKGGGVRTVPTDAYAARLMALEGEVKAAEEALARAEGR